MHKRKEIFQVTENVYLSILHIFLQLQGFYGNHVYAYKWDKVKAHSRTLEAICTSTACDHVAKLSPSHPPTQHGFILTAYREEPLALAGSQTMPGWGLVSREQSQGKEHKKSLMVWVMQGSAGVHTSDPCSLLVWMQLKRLVRDTDKKLCVCIFNINWVWSEGAKVRICEGNVVERKLFFTFLSANAVAP